MDPKHSHGPDRIDYQELPGDLSEVHASIQREHPEPTAQVTPIPMWLTAVCGLAVCWAGLYLGFFNGGLKGDVFNELATSPALLFPAPSKGAGVSLAAAEPSLAEQGKAVYATCQACHQATGTGQPGVIPPLAKSPFVLGSEKRLVSIVLKGLAGPVTVNGAAFNSQMQAWEGAFSNKKIAAVATFIRSSWGNNAPPITEAQVAAARKEYADHKAQMSASEVLAIPEDATLPGADGPGAGQAGKPTPDTSAPNVSAGGTPPAAVPPASPSAPAAGQAPSAPVPPSAPGAGAPPVASATPEQIEAGKKVYMTICFACHQITGAGLPMVFPPLTKSPYVNGPAERLIAIVLKGNMGPFTVDGKPFNNVMTPQEALLDDAKIAAVTTYVRASFGNSAPPVSVPEVTAARAKFAERKTAWTQPELDAWK